MLSRLLVAAPESTRLAQRAERNMLTKNVGDRFVAGHTLEDALTIARQLNDWGATVTLEHRGEAVCGPAGAAAERDAYLGAIARIAEERLCASISVKPTAIGLATSPDLFGSNLRALSQVARSHGIHVTVDMEGSDTTDATVVWVAVLRSQGYDVGCAVQANLHRTSRDVQVLTELGASLRLCTGAYAGSPTVAVHGRSEIRNSYLRAARQILIGPTYGRFATHDDWLIERIVRLAEDIGRPRDTWEIEMLHGVRQALQWTVRADGHRLRIHLPYRCD